ncbi:MAG: outer membrane lipid asymmetry maintenance protein MlaD [Burkholderiales bacterium]|nr:outer membrane lipid asymmetry maintenance protein MlaD [Burkholderiales bacterium]MDQ3195710.1 outer membrane lipid asymmetry maintenance protein MlaD [Pseudomonadota bacterium]
MERKTLDLWVGVFVALGIGALLFLAVKVGNLSAISVSDTYEVHAHFDNIGGLKRRAPVKSAGVVVGNVVDINFDPERFDAKVTLGIDKRYPFTKDTTASILTSGLLGEQYLGLEAGADPESLQPGDTLELTQSAVVLEKLIGKFLFSTANDSKDPAGTAAPSSPASPAPPGFRPGE